MALSGEFDRAESLADELAAEFPTDTLMIAVQIPALRAAVELEKGNPARAIELLESALPYELAGDGGLSIPFLRGQAYLALNDGEKAAAEFQKIIDHPTLGMFAVVYPLARLGLARARVLQGDDAGARKVYQDFLALWKDADPDIPIFIEAQAEYAKLQ